jgi:hypothetical protein
LQISNEPTHAGRVGHVKLVIRYLHLFTTQAVDRGLAFAFIAASENNLDAVSRELAADFQTDAAVGRR